MYKGLHNQCLARTSVVFETVVMVPWKSLQARGFPIMRDVREEFTKDQTTGGQLDPVVNALKWMKKQQ